jgi:hypothetical protein
MPITTPDFPMMTVGIRSPKQVKVYPLSFADARKLKGLLLGLMHSISELKQDGFDPIEVASYVLSVIEENIEAISNMVLSEPVEESEFSIEQVAILANHIYDMNEGAVKNLLGLWKKFRTEEPTKAEKE